MNSFFKEKGKFFRELRAYEVLSQQGITHVSGHSYQNWSELMKD
jgi:hypothetical protein